MRNHCAMMAEGPGVARRGGGRRVGRGRGRTISGGASLPHPRPARRVVVAAWWVAQHCLFGAAASAAVPATAAAPPLSCVRASQTERGRPRRGGPGGGRQRKDRDVSSACRRRRRNVGGVGGSDDGRPLRHEGGRDTGRRVPPTATHAACLARRRVRGRPCSRAAASSTRYCRRWWGLPTPPQPCAVKRGGHSDGHHPRDPKVGALAARAAAFSASDTAPVKLRPHSCLQPAGGEQMRKGVSVTHLLTCVLPRLRRHCALPSVERNVTFAGVSVAPSVAKVRRWLLRHGHCRWSDARGWWLGCTRDRRAQRPPR